MRRPTTAVALLGLATSVLLVVAGCTGHPPAAESTTTAFPGVPLVPEQGVHLGIYYGDGSADDTDAAIGSSPAIHLTYFGWEDAWPTSDEVTSDIDAGRIPLVNWEPFGVDLAAIVRGDHDELLAQRAAEAASLDAPVFVDFAAEMNEEEGWGDHDPELYTSAFRHVHDLFEGRDGGNVVWVWAPNNVDSAGEPAALDYYPGDDYVDWTGIDGYNWGTSEEGFEWQDFEAVFGPMYEQLHTLGKPIIIGETASAEEGGSKAEWIAGIAPALGESFPDIRALVWFDVDKERDWRIRSSDDSLAAFRDLVGE